jgi:stage II sporulation protein AA (anti-sigma F factor antagonist)
MNINEERRGAVVVVKPEGPLSQDDASQFRARVATVSQRSLGRFVVDLSRVPFTDSRGLEALVDLSEQLAQSGRGLKLCGANETLREVFTLTDVAMLFEHYDDANSAVRSFL